MPTLETLPFDNAFARLPAAFYTRLPPEPLPAAHILPCGKTGAGASKRQAKMLKILVCF